METHQVRVIDAQTLKEYDYTVPAATKSEAALEAANRFHQEVPECTLWDVVVLHG